jgi:hypothetical protein
MKKLFQGEWRQGLGGYYCFHHLISQLFPEEYLGSLFAGMEDWSKREEYCIFMGKSQGSNQATLKNVSGTHVIKLGFATHIWKQSV